MAVRLKVLAPPLGDKKGLVRVTFTSRTTPQELKTQFQEAGFFPDYTPLVTRNCPFVLCGALRLSDGVNMGEYPLTPVRVGKTRYYTFNPSSNVGGVSSVQKQQVYPAPIDRETAIERAKLVNNSKGGS